MCFIRNLNLLQQLPILTDIDTVFQTTSTNPIYRNFQLSPHVSSNKLIIHISFKFFIIISACQTAQAKLWLRCKHTVLLH